MLSAHSKPRLSAIAIIAMGAGIAFEAAHALFGLGRHGLDALTKDGVYTAVELIAVGTCAITRAETAGRSGPGRS